MDVSEMSEEEIMARILEIEEQWCREAYAIMSTEELVKEYLRFKSMVENNEITGFNLRELERLRREIHARTGRRPEEIAGCTSEKN